MAITITDAAASRVKQFLEERADSVGLRFGVKKTGCSGFAYVVDLADDIKAEDHVYDSNGIRIVVDPKSLPLVDGTEIDFAKHGLGESFQFRNPNVKSECGCGESFGV